MINPLAPEPHYSFLENLLHRGPLAILGYFVAVAFLAFGIANFTRAMLTRTSLDGATRSFAWVPFAIGAAIAAMPICFSLPLVPGNRGIAEYPPLEVMLGECFEPLLHGALGSLSLVVLVVLTSIFKRRAESPRAGNAPAPAAPERT